MRRAIGHFAASNKSFAVTANSGRKRVCFIQTAGRKTDYIGDAKYASVNIPANVTSGLGKLAEEICDMRIVTEPLMVSNRSYAASAEGGKARVSLTRIIWEKTDYSGGVRNVYTNQPNSLVREGRL